LDASSGLLVAEPSTIVVLGGPSAGKTVYVSVLYHHLWSGHEGMLMRAGNGATHAELLKSADSLAGGKMPPATQALRHYEFELEHNRRLYYVRYLDYPGELFRKVFFDMAVDSDEARELLRTCENAAGVLVLVDPQSVVDEGWETDYALSNLFRFYQSNDADPKFVFAFTKRDENHRVVGDHITAFVKQNLPHVSRLLGGGMRMMHFSSIIKSQHSVQLSRADIVKAPLESILGAIEGEQTDRARQALQRRWAIRDAIARAGWFLVILICVLCSFTIGVFLRHLVELHRSAPPPLGEGG